MPVYYFDTSALVKHYHRERGSDRVEAILDEPHSHQLISRLAVTELMSAFGLMTRSGRLAVGQFELFTRRLRKQVGARILHVVAISDEDFSGAEVLLEKYARTRALKASDAVQAAVAARLRRVVDHFVCADRDLSEVARLEGFSVIDPEQS